MRGEDKPSPNAVLSNLAAPMPLGRKIYLIFRHNLIKIIRRRTCCGNQGEPGC